MDLTKPHIINLPTVRDPRGSLTVLEHEQGNLPFEIARAWWIYDVPSDSERHGHAMLSQTEVLIALAGSFDVVTRTAAGTRTFHLDRNYRALYLPPMTWREIINFSTGSIALVLSDALYEETDYVRSLDRFNEIIRPQS